MPAWVHVLAVVSLVLAALAAVAIAIDIAAGHHQRMAIMNVVWPVTALYAGPLALWAYWKIGRHPDRDKPFWATTALAATHCGAGCTCGDLVAEWVVVAVPIVVFGHAIFGTWILDYALAFTFGIVFQYLTIVPMKDLPPAKGIVAALEADTLSLTAWQVGMYGWMAIVVFGIVGHELPKTSPEFWFMMQIAMLLGFLTSYPVNWWLLRRGVKEAM